jgi:type IV secretion system protein VirB10
MAYYQCSAIFAILTSLFIALPLSGADPDRDFSGKWTLDASASRIQSIDGPADPAFTVVQQDAAIHCSNNASFALDGSETKYRIGGATFSTAVKWEGAALLINALVSGPRDYTLMDRWKLSRDRNTLTITRQVMHGTRMSEGTLVYRAEGWRGAAPTPPVVSALPPSPGDGPPQPVEASRPRLIRPDAEAARRTPVEATVQAGTRIPLALRNAVDTKHSREGDHIYLETIYPVSVNGRIVIPSGSFVNGTITLSNPAGRGRKKGEMYIRFDSLTLPTGATRDFHSHLVSAEGKNVDPDEGKVTGEADKGREAGQVAATTGMGAGIGGIAGASSGHALKGVGIGSAIGAAAGLATVLMKTGPEATLRRGTTLEMVLDRDLTFTSSELRW